MSKRFDYVRSRYNYFIERDEGVIGYNARTGTFALLSSENAEILRGDGDLKKAIDPRQLRRMGFLHKDDEIELIKKTFLASRGGDTLHLTLVPTLACNYSCEYCFQASYRTSAIMRPEVEEQLLQYIESCIQFGWRRFLVTWFGGEPLLRKAQIIKLTEDIRKVVRSARGKLDVTMVTNGALLDQDTAKELDKLGMRNVQICFDSLQEQTGLRGMRTSTGEPSRIYKNLLESKDHLDIQVRINVTNKNAHEVENILDDLRANSVPTVVLSHVYDYEGDAGYATNSDGKRNPSDGPCGHGCSLGRSEYATLENLALSVSDNGMQMLARKLTPKSAACSASAHRMIVIGPDGSISRCWHSVGAVTEQSGHISEGYKPLPSSASNIDKQWADYSPFENERCKSCNVLPLCMGGCAHPRIFMDQSLTPCDAVRFNIEKYVGKIGRAILISDAEAALINSSDGR
ncbi:MAG: SPASM domain-containing protein [Candidatus Pacebacteria bacterium]|jgi:uncharacterized protein|nr:SPASM domain-containing protein [Candidatus Paceibacterota bacterium]